MNNKILNDGIMIMTIFPMDYFDLFKDAKKLFDIRIRRHGQSEMFNMLGSETRWDVHVYFRSEDRAYFIDKLNEKLKTHVNKEHDQ